MNNKNYQYKRLLTDRINKNQLEFNSNHITSIFYMNTYICSQKHSLLMTPNNNIGPVFSCFIELNHIILNKYLIINARRVLQAGFVHRCCSTAVNISSSKSNANGKIKRSRKLH